MKSYTVVALCLVVVIIQSALSDAKKQEGAPGNSGNAPGHNKGSSGAPGNSGSAPGNSNEESGSDGNGGSGSGNAPKNGGSPGNSGKAPGQNKKNSGDSDSKRAHPDHPNNARDCPVKGQHKVNGNCVCANGGQPDAAGKRCVPPSAGQPEGQPAGPPVDQP